MGLRFKMKDGSMKMPAMSRTTAPKAAAGSKKAPAKKAPVKKAPKPASLGAMRKELKDKGRPIDIQDLNHYAETRPSYIYRRAYFEVS